MTFAVRVVCFSLCLGFACLLGSLAQSPTLPTPIPTPVPTPTPRAAPPSPSPSSTLVSLDNDNVLYIGVPAAYVEGATGTAQASGFQAFTLGMNVSFTMWMETVNNRGGIKIGAKYYNVSLRVVSVGDANTTVETAKVKAESLKLCRGDYGRVDFVFATYSSGYAPLVADACEPYRVPSISGHSSDEANYRCTYTDVNKTKLPNGCASDGERRYEWAVSVQSKASNYLPGYLQLAKLKDAKTVGVFNEAASFARAIASGVKATADELNMPVLFEKEVPRQIGQLGVSESSYTSTSGLDPGELASLEDLLNLIEEHDADALAGGTYYDLCRNLMVRFKARNYLPKSIGMTTCMGEDLIRDVGSYVLYVMGASGWDYRLKGPQYTESSDNPIFHFAADKDSGADLTSSEQFRNQFVAHPMYQQLNLTGDPSYQAVGAYVIGYAVHETLRKAQNTSRDSWLQYWWALQINTIYGPLVLDTSGINYAKEFITLQVDEQQKQQIVAPLSSATLSGVYPMPGWNERAYVDAPYNTISEQAILGVAGFFIVLTLVLMALLVAWRDKPQILAASIVFCEIILLGGLLAFASLFFWGIWATQWTCITHAWLIVIGFDLLLGSLLIKNWRIQRIFKAASSLKKTSIPNSQLLRAVGIVLVVDVALLLVWHIAFTPDAVVVVPDLYRPALNYYVCTSTVRASWREMISPSAIETGFVAALGTYKGVQLIAGVVMAFMLRNTPSAFNEAKYIGYALYNMFFCLILLVLVWQLIPSTELVLLHALRSIVILWGIAISLAAIFVPKIYFVVTGEKNPAKDTQPTRRTMNNSFAADRSSSSSSETDRADLRLQIVNLQKELEAARDEVKKRAEGEPRASAPPAASPKESAKPASASSSSASLATEPSSKSASPEPSASESSPSVVKLSGHTSSSLSGSGSVSHSGSGSSSS